MIGREARSGLAESAPQWAVEPRIIIIIIIIIIINHLITLSHERV